MRARAGWMKKNSSSSIAGLNVRTRPFVPLYASRADPLTGQCVEEIARLHVDQWDAKERIIEWVEDQEQQAARHPGPWSRRGVD